MVRGGKLAGEARSGDPRLCAADLLAAALFALLVACWSLAIPYNGAPDEQTHLFLVEYLYRFHSMPTAGRDPISSFVGPLSGDTFSRETFWYFGLPYLHALGATVYASLFAPLLPTGAGYLAARAFDWTLGFIFILALLATARRQRLRGAWPFAVVAAVASIPQVTFVFAYFNADAFALTCTAVALASFLRMVDQPSRTNSLLFGLACGLLLCSKIYHFPALVFFAVLLGVRKLTMPILSLVRPAGLALAAALLVAAPVLGVTYLQFGEVTGLSGQQAFVALHRGDPAMLYGTCFLWCKSAVVSGRWVLWWGTLFFQSFFMTTGWMDVTISRKFYAFLFAPATALLAIASVVLTLRALRCLRSGQADAAWDVVIPILFWGMVVGTTLLNLIGSQNLLPQPQGRYLFVVLPFAVLLIARLVGASVGGASGAVPASRGRLALLVPAVTALMLVANLAGFAATLRHAGGHYPAIGIAERR